MIKLIDNGTSEYRILIPQDASPSQEWVAKQLQKYILKASNCKLPIEQGFTLNSPYSIVLGHNEPIIHHVLTVDPDHDKIGDEGYYIKTSDETILIIGSETRGTVYGVFSFLEDYLGFRFYSPEITIIPEIKSLEIPDIEVLQVPDFQYRLATYLSLMDPKHSVKIKANMNPFLEEKHGGKWSFSLQHMTHTFYQLIKPSKYFKEHPEYFALVEGQRKGQDAQLCLTNLEVIRISTEEVLNWIEIELNTMSFGVIQNDCAGYCECDECKAVDEKEGSHAGSLIYFVNEIAKVLKEKAPDVFIHTIAYTYTEGPPRTLKPEDNVIVVMCHMHPSCDNHPLEECDVDARYVNNLKGWLKICDQVLVWHYITDFKHYLMPFPNFNAISKDIRFYHDLGVIGFLGQAGFSSLQEFDELRNYMILKMLWNKEVNLQKLYDEYFNKVYGPAGEFIQEYFNALQERANDPNVHMHLYSGLESGYIDGNFIINSNELFNKAEMAVKNDNIYSKRVRKSRISLDYVMLLQPIKFIMRLGAIMPIDLKEKTIILDRFKKDVKEFGVTAQGEDLGMKSFLDYCDTVYKVNSYTGLLELSPIVMKIIDEILEKVREVKDSGDNIDIFKLIGPVLKSGLDPRSLMQWFQDKKIAQYNENNIWEREIIEDNLNKWRNPENPETDLKIVPKKYIEDY